jgi:hypothetical protein
MCSNLYYYYFCVSVVLNLRGLLGGSIFLKKKETKGKTSRRPRLASKTRKSIVKSNHTIILVSHEP